MSSHVPPYPLHRIVVVGHGMVAARFLDELDRLVPPGTSEVTVLGAEPYRAYNRLLLTEVLAGRADLAGLTLPDAPHHVRVLSGVSATHVRREEQVVVDDRGGLHPYDTLVLATGADPRLPALEGLSDADDEGHPCGVRGVQALRTVDDCRALLALRGRTRPDGSPLRVTVLGGGVLGLEAARALADHGLTVTIVHSGAHPMDARLDAAEGAVVRRCLSQQRIRLATRARAESVTSADGAITGVVLRGGRRIDTDLLLLTAGVSPRTGLAARAGLDVDRGVVVGADLRTPRDPHVAAIGDCAQTPEGCPGLLSPGWEQAASLARHLAAQLSAEVENASGTRAGGAGDVIRVKADDLDVVVFGTMPADPFSSPTDRSGFDDDNGADALDPPSTDRSGSRSPRVLHLLDLDGGRSLRVAVHEGRVVAGVLVGAGTLAADLLLAYERGTPVPLDPARLLVKGGDGGTPVASSPASIPGAATICRCNGVTKSDVVAAFEQGERTPAAVAARTRATTGCGGCTSTVEGLLEWLDAADPAPPAHQAPPVDAAPLAAPTSPAAH